MPTTDRSALLYTPATLTVAGIALGIVRDVALVVEKHTTEVMEEGFGCKVPIAVLGVGETWGILAVLASVDEGKASQFFQSGAVGPSGETGIVYPGGSTGALVLPGQWLAGVSVQLTPLDPMQWSVYFPNAVPVAVDPEVVHSMDENAGIPVAFLAMPPLSGANGQTAQWRPAGDLSL